MALLTANYITFIKQGTTGVQTITGVGFQGKALLLWSTRLTGLGTATGTQQMNAMTDGVKQSCRFIHHPGGETATTSSQAERTEAG